MAADKRIDFSQDELNRLITTSILEKKDFSAKYDVIVIGSGASGMTSACLLAKAGLTVLVLEQHDTLGGFCHTFTEEGHEFPTGVHFFVEAESYDDVSIRVINFVTDGLLQFKELKGKETFCFGPNSKKSDNFTKPCSVRESEMIDVLCDRFPSEKKAITTFMSHMKKAAEAFYVHFFIKYVSLGRYVPFRVERFLKSWVIGPMFNSLHNYYSSQSVSKMMDLSNLKHDTKLRTIFLSTLELIGCSPSDLVFPLFSSTFYGCLTRFHLVGGPSQLPKRIAQCMMSTNHQPHKLRRGLRSECFVNARVKSFVLDKKQNRVVGVKLDNGTEFESKYGVISSAGVVNTIGMIDNKVERKRMERMLRNSELTAGGFHFFVFVGFEKSGKAMREMIGEEDFFRTGVLYSKTEFRYEDRTEFWGVDVDDLMEKGKGKDSSYSVFVGFHNMGEGEEEEGKNGSVSLLMEVNGSWFREWSGTTKPKARGRGYEELKECLTDVVLDLFYSSKVGKMVKDSVNYVESGSPLSTEYYGNWKGGGGYGLKMDRNKLRATEEWITPQKFAGIDGLYLTGQDLLCDGVNAAITSGLLAAGAVLGRNLLWDCMMAGKRKNDDE